MTIEYKDSKRIVATSADVAVVSNRGTIDFTGGLGNTDSDDVAHFESTGQLNKIIGELYCTESVKDRSDISNFNTKITYTTYFIWSRKEK